MFVFTKYLKHIFLGTTKIYEIVDLYQNHTSDSLHITVF